MSAPFECLICGKEKAHALAVIDLSDRYGCEHCQTKWSFLGNRRTVILPKARAELRGCTYNVPASSYSSTVILDDGRGLTTLESGEAAKFSVVVEDRVGAIHRWYRFDDEHTAAREKRAAEASKEAAFLNRLHGKLAALDEA